MSTEIAISILGLIAAIVVPLIVMTKGFRRQDETLKSSQARLLSNFEATTNLRLDQLERKMDKHNCLIERMTKVEGRTEQAHSRIDELRDEFK